MEGSAPRKSLELVFPQADSVLLLLVFIGLVLLVFMLTMFACTILCNVKWLTWLGSKLNLNRPLTLVSHEGIDLEVGKFNQTVANPYDCLESDEKSALTKGDRPGMLPSPPPHVQLTPADAFFRAFRGVAPGSNLRMY